MHEVPPGSGQRANEELDPEDRQQERRHEEHRPPSRRKAMAV